MSKAGRWNGAAACGCGRVALTFGMFGLLAGAGCTAAKPTTAKAYSGFGREQPVSIIGYDGDAMEPFVTSDGRYLLFNNSNDPAINTNIFYAERGEDDRFRFRGPVAGVNTAALDGVPSIDDTGDIVFVSTRSYATTASTLFSGRFANGTVTSVALIAGVSRQQPGVVNFDAGISPDGKTLWFDDGDFTAAGQLKAAKIVVANRIGAGFFRRADSETVLARINTGGLNYAPAISRNGLELFFTRVDSLTSGHAPMIMRATRGSTTAAFDAPQRVAATAGFVEAPALSKDGHALYYHKRIDGRYRLYRVNR